MPEFFSFISEILWGSFMVYLLAAAGIWFAVRSQFVPFRFLRDFGKSLKSNRTPQPNALTAYQALCLSMATRLGSGNLAGVAFALTSGGPGAVFWMWIAALIGMVISFAECSLAQLYKERDTEHQFRGGPAWYMARGLGMRWMGVLFSVFLLLTYGLVFNTIQSSAVARAMHFAWGVPGIVSGMVLALCVLFFIVRGLKPAARLMQWLVPVIGLAWILVSLCLSLWHANLLPGIFATIIKSAFGWQEAATGTMAYTLSQAMTSGFQRSMFANEAGLGSSPNVAAMAVSWPPHPVAQGIVQMIGVLTDTFLVCTASALVLLLPGMVPLSDAFGGIQQLQQAMTSLTGGWGAGFVACIVVLFAFTSIVANYIYAENNLIFLRCDSNRNLWLLRIGILLMVVIGTLSSVPLIWHIADVVMALMAMINLTAILLLSPVVRVLARDYLRQRKLGVMPVFDPQRYPEIKRQLAPGSWDDIPRS
ncbi:alanine/glycine:cation symporter family protein [Kosakonia oryzae]|uniref:alanine/glycine:cation symporter family protein n=1 Tax=Kosakonia oryzae TaxID=497725 RepID=UPI001D08C895|nr:sodium:alanine symporter family protein [Kosakonia oryzae]UDJ81702.1 sodium:alanine symporter family protein [Kosakonia oryzae]